MKVDLDEIERVAKIVQRDGTWGPVFRAIRNRLDLVAEEEQHIANCSPDVILALVARVRELEQRLEPSRLQELLEMRLLDVTGFPYAASKESIAEIVEAIVF